VGAAGSAATAWAPTGCCPGRARLATAPRAARPRSLHDAGVVAGDWLHVTSAYESVVGGGGGLGGHGVGADGLLPGAGALGDGAAGGPAALVHDAGVVVGDWLHVTSAYESVLGGGGGLGGLGVGGAVLLPGAGALNDGAAGGFVGGAAALVHDAGVVAGVLLHVTSAYESVLGGGGGLGGLGADGAGLLPGAGALGDGAAGGAAALVHDAGVVAGIWQHVTSAYESVVGGGGGLGVGADGLLPGAGALGDGAAGGAAAHVRAHRTA